MHRFRKPKVNCTLWAWGGQSNSYSSAGILGLGDVINRSSPVQVGALSTWTSVNSGRYHALATKSDGTLWELGGFNNQGQLGVGDTINRSSPIQIGALTTWTSVAAGGGHSFAIKSDGTLWTFGGDNYGRLGINYTGPKSTPFQVGALTDWSAVSLGMGHSLALKSNGTLWAWGWGHFGQLGHGIGDAAASRSSPIQIGALTTWTAISAKGYVNFAIKSDGTLWTWGRNTGGRLGVGDTDNRSSPVQVGALTTWTSIVAGRSHILALQSNGTLWTWGYGSQGYLGIGDVNNRSSPVQVGALTTWTSIGSGYTHSLAVKSDGTLWTWGRNQFGQLGLGDTDSRSSPVQVGALTSWVSVSGGDRGASFALRRG